MLPFVTHTAETTGLRCPNPPNPMVTQIDTHKPNAMNNGTIPELLVVGFPPKIKFTIGKLTK